jgi:hypothetical protein
MYEVGLGESPMSIAGALSGNPARFGELLAANPHKPLARVHGRVTFAVLVQGEFLHVPHGWDRPHPRLRAFTPLPAGYLGSGNGDTLGTNQSLKVGESITSPDGNVTVAMQQDGNLVIKTNSDGTLLWQSGTPGGVIAWMNWDGNLRVEAPGGRRLWDNGAHGHKDARARIENTGNLYVWDGGHHMIWDAGASVARPNPVPGGHGAAHTDFGGIDHDLKRLSRDIEHFSKDVIDDVKKFGPMILSEVQGLISLIPGIGTGISAAIGLAMALLEGGSPLVIAIRTAYGAIPVPPGIRNVTDPVVDGCIHFAENPHDFTDVVIKTIRDQVPGGLPREIFDTLVKIIIKHQPILKVVASVVTDVAGQIPAVKSLIAAMPPVGTILPSIQQIAPNGVHVDVANIPNMVQAAQAIVQHPDLTPQNLANIAQQAQQRYVPLHALAVVTSATQLAHKLGGTQASIAVLEHPLHAPAAIAAQHPAPPPLHAGPGRGAYLPYMHGRAGGHTAAYLPYVHGNMHATVRFGGRVHGVGECAPPCSRLGDPVDMDHRMSQVARMLVTARKGQPTVAKGPDGVDYRFEDVDGAVVARRCLG